MEPLVNCTEQGQHFDPNVHEALLALELEKYYPMLMDMLEVFWVILMFGFTFCYWQEQLLLQTVF